MYYVFQLEQNIDGYWTTVYEDGKPVCLYTDNRHIEGWLNTTCKANYRWRYI